MRQAIAILLLLAVPGLAQESKSPKHRYLFVYTVPVLDYTRQTLMNCSEPGCNDIYYPEERHEWFDSLPNALKRMNDFTNPDTRFPLSTSLPSHKLSGYFAVLGLYETVQVPVVLEKIGTKHQQVQKVVDEEVPQLEWRIKP
jgi:hypothetical protein